MLNTYLLKAVWEAAGDRTLRVWSSAYNHLHISCQLGVCWDSPSSAFQPIICKSTAEARHWSAQNHRTDGGNTWPPGLWVVLKSDPAPPFGLALILSRPQRRLWPDPLLHDPLSQPLSLWSWLLFLFSSPVRAVWMTVQNKIIRLQNPSKAISYFI